jgi:hypothetical protein
LTKKTAHLEGQICSSILASIASRIANGPSRRLHLCLHLLHRQLLTMRQQQRLRRAQ